MKITETILTQLTDTETLLESVYQAIAEVDPDYAEEIATYSAICRSHKCQDFLRLTEVGGHWTSCASRRSAYVLCGNELKIL